MSIDSIVGLVAGKIGELLIQEGKLLYGVKDQVQRLQRELRMMHAFLIDMEAKDEEGGDARTRTTLAEIRKIAYDAEDAIESYILVANSSTHNKAEGALKRYACFCISLSHNHQAGSEIEVVEARITETMERLQKYQGENGVNGTDVGAGARQIRGNWRTQIAYPHTNEEHVVGLEEDINKLVGVLTTDGTEVQLLSILGMGGSGKTTLARKLYNHESVKSNFDCIAWVSISKDWAAKDILIQLLRKASGVETMGKDEDWSHQVLVEKLHQYLERKTYLIFLDDVWTKQVLEEIFPALPNDGGKIIVTTRKRQVTDFSDVRCSIHEPRRLTEEESWELFRKIALIHREQSNNSALETLGKEMLKKCEGLPLAVVALAGILSDKKTLEEWERFKKAVSSRIVEDDKGTRLYGPVKEMIGLSYNDLPRVLKTCFLHLAMFPEDSEIRTGHLIRLWIAEGFITTDMLQEGDTLEDVARDYLEELIRRCVVQIASRNYEGKVRSIRVHDLVRDLCIKKAKEQDFLQIFTAQSSCSNGIGAETRRTAIYSLDKMYLPLPTQSHHLRSLVHEASLEFDDTRRLSFRDISKNFRLLRVLILEDICIRESSLPTGIGSLIHLRHLGLRWTNLRRLPSSIGNLRNLLTLDCRWSALSLNDYEYRIPNVLWKIEGLRHLYLHDKRFKAKVKLHTLKHLQTLKGIRGGGWMLEELPRLSPTLQKLDIMAIRSKEQLEAAFQCQSITLDRLHSLDLSWSVGRNSKVMLENLQPIMHCQHLRKLSLWGRIKDTSSSCNQFPTGIIKLVLGETCFEEADLAALGKLPNLMFLKLQFWAYVGAKWTWIPGQFSQLKGLQLSYLSDWEEWSVEMGAMPQLTRLEIDHCEKVRRLPEGLKFITTLQELIILEDGDELKKRIKGGEKDGEGGGEDAHIIQHVPLVQIHDTSVHSQKSAI